MVVIAANGALGGKAALVIGCGSRIGRAAADALTALGAEAILADVAQPDTPFGVRLVDVSDESSVRRLAESIRADRERVDILVNCAGIFHVEPLASYPSNAWRRTLDVNLSGAFYAIQAFLPDMLAANWGRIINVASVLSFKAAPSQVGYVAAKHGLLGLTRAVALEIAPSGVTCNAVCPGLVRTAAVEARISDLMQAGGVDEETATTMLLSTRQPSRRLIEASSVGETISLLALPSAGEINGVGLPVDGGWSTI